MHSEEARHSLVSRSFDASLFTLRRISQLSPSAPGRTNSIYSSLQSNKGRINKQEGSWKDKVARAENDTADIHEGISITDPETSTPILADCIIWTRAFWNRERSGIIEFRKERSLHTFIFVKHDGVLRRTVWRLQIVGRRVTSTALEYQERVDA